MYYVERVLKRSLKQLSKTKKTKDHNFFLNNGVLQCLLNGAENSKGETIEFIVKTGMELVKGSIQSNLSST
jgi:hypothetical protein